MSLCCEISYRQQAVVRIASAIRRSKAIFFAIFSLSLSRPNSICWRGITTDQVRYLLHRDPGHRAHHRQRALA